MPGGSYKGKEKERVHSGGPRLLAPLPPPNPRAAVSIGDLMIATRGRHSAYERGGDACRLA